MAAGAIRNRFIEEVSSGLVLGGWVGNGRVSLGGLMVREMSSQYTGGQ